jgi:hypothetical protein
MDLPIYENKATPEEQKLKLELMADQIKLLHVQEKDGVPLMRVKIRCGCRKLLPWWVMVKCLYCGIFYCPECAEEHFGMRRAQREEA